MLIGPGWCTSDKATLADNLKHRTLPITVDGQQVPAKLVQSAPASSDGVLSGGATPVPMECRYFAALAYDWPVGAHTVVVAWTWDADVNDGWNLYHKGTYVYSYAVTVTP